MENYKLICLKEIESFKAIKDEWDSFIDSNFPRSFNRRGNWLCSWWDSYGKTKQVSIYIVKNEKKGKIIAAVPLIISRQNFSGFLVRMVEILGKGIGTEDMAVIENQCECLKLIFNHLNKNTSWHLARFLRIEKKESTQNLIEHSIRNNYKYERIKTDNFFIKVNKNFVDYYQSRSKNFKKIYRNVLNRMRKSGDISFEKYSYNENIDGVFEKMEEIAVSSWQYKKGSSHFISNNGTCFMKNIFNDWNKYSFGQQVFLLLLNNKPIAYLFGIKHNKTFFAIDVAFDLNYTRLSPGRVLFVYIIENIFKSKDIDLFDFCGNIDYISAYSDLKSEDDSLLIYNRKFYSNFIYKFRSSHYFMKIKNLTGKL